MRRLFIMLLVLALFASVMVPIASASTEAPTATANVEEASVNSFSPVPVLIIAVVSIIGMIYLANEFKKQEQL